MNPDVIADIVATSFNADRPVLHRYSATVVLRAPDKAATHRRTGYGENADSARINAIRAALQSWGCVTIAPEEVRVSSRTLPDGYGAPYLTDADKCTAIADLLPMGSRVRRDLLAAADWYKAQYLAVRYDYLNDR